MSIQYINSNEGVSNKNTKKLVRLESVISDVYRLIDPKFGISEDDLLESAASGMSHLVTYRLYEKVVCLKVIDDHNVVLPHDWAEIDSVWYRADFTSQDCDDAIQSTNTNLCESSVTQSDVYHMQRSRYFDSWQFMHLHHSIATMMRIGGATQSQTSVIGTTTTTTTTENANGTTTTVVTESDITGRTASPSPCHDCELTYSIKGDVLTASPRTGFVLIVYKRTLSDTDGHPLIPHSPLINEALKTYVFMEMYQKKMHHSDQGALGMYQMYSEKWERLSAAAIGDEMLPTLPEWVEIVKQNKLMKGDGPITYFDKDSPERFNLDWY